MLLFPQFNQQPARPEVILDTATRVITGYLDGYWQQEAEIINALRGNRLPPSFKTMLRQEVNLQMELALEQARREAVRAMQDEFGKVLVKHTLDEIVKKINSSKDPKERAYLRAVYSYSKHCPPNASLHAECQFLIPRQLRKLEAKEKEIRASYDFTPHKAAINNRFVAAVIPFLKKSEVGYPLYQDYIQFEANRSRLLEIVTDWLNHENRNRPSARVDRLRRLRDAIRDEPWKVESRLENILRRWEWERVNGTSNLQTFSSHSLTHFWSARPCRHLEELWEVLLPARQTAVRRNQQWEEINTNEQGPYMQI